MKIDACASEPHYAAHIRPIWDALPADARGTFWVAGKARWSEVGGIRVGRPGASADPLLVASYSDAKASPGRSLILLEHGSGQTYTGSPAADRNPCYSGGTGHERVVLFLAPNETVAARWRHHYPATPAVAVGTPYLDRWHLKGSLLGVRDRVAAPTVALSFHWENRLVPESRSTFPHYNPDLPALCQWAKSNSMRLLGHGHPRLWGRIVRRWQQLGVDHTPGFADVLDRADVYICDNSSTLYEFASTDRPVVVLNAPWYRRDVSHGLRFWEHADVGIQVDEPADLPDAIAEALTDPPAVAQRRREVVREVCPLADGHATQRAVEAICGVLNAAGSARITA